ncbi:hypothetical protein Taro_027029 [Colocasia esculenta]|uniref:Co-chaperone protein p23 n=1 Tax=Colocasia esculenta TaxID=4460 RepID=A0A843V7N0_COLES|nr:hypothetical protein [Colocasia esculenta]
MLPPPRCSPLKPSSGRSHRPDPPALSRVYLLLPCLPASVIWAYSSCKAGSLHKHGGSAESRDDDYRESLRTTSMVPVPRNKRASIRHPEVKWAQRADKVYITILLPDAKDVKVNLEPEGALSFSAYGGAENNLYELKLDLYDKESKINVGVRNIFCVVEKVEKVWWKKLLRGDEKPPHYLKVDWDKWADEDEDTGPGDLDFGGMDFSKFGGMEGAGDGMDDDLDDTDDEDQEVENREPADGGGKDAGENEEASAESKTAPAASS